VRYHPEVSSPLSYGRYLKIPELLSLQQLLSRPRHHDELLFIVIHQVYELWFKQVLHEVDAAAGLLARDRVVEGTRLLRRVVEIQRLLIHQVRILETMRPQDFLGFRALLNPASGFQSLQFRELEFALGLKRPELLEALDSEGEALQPLEARLAAPSLGDVVDDLLGRRGFPRDPDPGPAEGGASRSEEWRVRALVRIYEEEEQHPELNALCEVMIEIDECLALWRAHHVQMVERMIGARRGTGGSEGVPYLRSTLDKRAFPDLWLARSRIQGAPDAPGVPVG
jgi:tryptophan 2,3-dioxygenase